MKEIQLLLVPEPGKPAQPLATLTVHDPSPAVAAAWDQVHQYSKTVVLEGYTRDGWAWKPEPLAWHSVVVRSTDGRKKLPGFVKYLKDRQKCAFGRFLLHGTTGIWVVSYIQKGSSTGNNEDCMECRISTDLTRIPGCTLSATPPNKQQQAKPPAAAPAAAQAPLAAPGPKRTGAGLLGKLVGAQKITNQHVRNAKAPAPATAKIAAPTTTTMAVAPIIMEPTKTAGTVLAEFRNDMEQRMMDFDISAESEMRINLSLAEHTAGLSVEDQERVTMKSLEYMVMEAAEEVNEEWITYKEPSEFMDEATIAVYKEGCAPPEVLEEVNKVEVPDEVIQQQKHEEEKRQRQMAAEHRKYGKALESGAHATLAEDEDGGEALGTNKRDRRTMEDLERERKKGRLE